MEEEKMIVAIVPIKGRPDIISRTIPRLVRQVDKVIIAGHTYEERDICKDTDFYICAEDMKIGAKWQFCAERAREYNPDAILIMGSGCMITDNWIDTLFPYLETYDMVGGRSIYFLDYQRDYKRMFFWGGYNGERASEPVGPGRLISSSFLEKSKGQLFDADINRGLDFSTMRILRINEGNAYVYSPYNTMVIRLSSYKYIQYDSYDKLKKSSSAKDIENMDVFLKTNFPEAL